VTKPFSKRDIKTCIEILEQLRDSGELLAALEQEDRRSLLTVSGQLSRPSAAEKEKRQKEARAYKQKQKSKEDRKKRAKTGIRQARTDAVFTAPKQLQDTNMPSEPIEELESARNCYVCKAEFTKLHFFYDTMCASCADLNYRKRFQTASLTGKVAVITGSRLKIGYHATLMLLRAGAEVIATTRFPRDSAIRFAKEDDFKDWQHRLHIYGLDLRHTPSVELFTHYVETNYDRLDILINNAAQTVRRPPGFYAHLMENELAPLESLSDDARLLLADFEQCKAEISAVSLKAKASDRDMPVSWQGQQQVGIGLQASAQLSQMPYSFEKQQSVAEVFPKNKLDVDLQQVDLRETNSWRLKIGEIDTPEMVEVQLVNAIAPFVLCNRLSNMMKRDYTGEKHIVNVTAMEGKFHRFKKAARHPHTNMAKAALNMLTHTSAAELAHDGIFMNAVDTGWVTDEDPATLSKFKQDVHDFQPPLDIVDGAARVLDPLFDGIITGKHWVGKFLKDYFPIDW
jgi:NAD(P)-dependent dehydrogenase (short-subunit alcohol dehydrogenase family)